MFDVDYDESTRSTTGHETISGLTATVTIPEGHTGVIVAEFNADSWCSTSGSDGFCSVLLYRDGTFMQPADDLPGFDNTLDSGSYAAQSVLRVSDELGPGTYEVSANFLVSGPDMTFRIKNIVLTAEVKLTG